MHILFTWETGSNFGHIGNLLELCLKFKQEAHKVSVATSDLHRTSYFFPEDIPIFQAPLWQLQPAGRLPVAANYVEILAAQGFMSERGLGGMLHAWSSLFDSIKPDLLITESSPTALLAGKAYPFLKVQLGTGFSIPPAGQPFPNLIQVNNDRQARIDQLTGNMLSIINRVLASRRRPKIDSVPDIFDSGKSFVCTFPELDPYNPGRTGPYYGPLFITAQPNAVEWPSHGKYRIFVYLNPVFPGFKPLLKILQDQQYCTIAFVPNASANMMAESTGDNMKLVSEPVNLESIINECHLAITHAGHGLSSYFLLKGIPHLMIPMNLEQLLTANRIKALNAGLLLAHEDANRHYQETIQAILNHTAIQSSLKHLKSQYCTYNPQKTVNTVFEEITASFPVTTISTTPT